MKDGMLDGNYCIVVFFVCLFVRHRKLLGRREWGEKWKREKEGKKSSYVCV